MNEQIDALKTALGKLKAASKQNPPSLDPVINILGDVKDLTDFVGTNGKVKEATAASAATQKVIDGLKEINTLIATVGTIWSSARALSVDPRSLAPSKEETELAVLAVEVQYLKELTALRVWQQLDYAEVQNILTQLEDQVKSLDASHGVRADLAKVVEDMKPGADFDPLRQRMLPMVRTLYLAASASAQNTIAADIEATRETLAWRRYHIRTAAIYNGTYETAIQAASSRLAAYYAAGLKPSQIAQLVHDVAAAISLPKDCLLRIIIYELETSTSVQHCVSGRVRQHGNRVRKTNPGFAQRVSEEHQ